MDSVGHTIESVPTMDPRPTLDVTNLDSPRTLLKKRRRAMKRAMHRSTKASSVVSKYRRKQRRLLDGDSDSDPDPYDSEYIFFCLEGVRED
jgi:hypothetical protein